MNLEPIVDAHHHIRNRAHVPWLNGPIQPRIFGEYAAIVRDYPVEEYLGDARGCGVTKSVYVQANWAPERALDESRWVQAQADRTGYPHAIVAYADLAAADVEHALEQQAGIRKVRGIRQQLHWHVNPL